MKDRREYLREYARGYRAEGFGKVNDRSYYMRNREKILEKARASYRKKLRNTCENN